MSDREPLDSTTRQLLTLIRRGFRFTHPHGASGDLLAIQGVRVHQDVIDVVVLRGENDARAVRMPGDEEDILAPEHVLWEKAGRAHEVLTALLELPDKESGVGIYGCWVPTQPGHVVWLPAATG
jgi:hypothetical protein